MKRPDDLPLASEGVPPSLHPVNQSRGGFGLRKLLGVGLICLGVWWFFIREGDSNAALPEVVQTSPASVVPSAVGSSSPTPSAASVVPVVPPSARLRYSSDMAVGLEVSGQVFRLHPGDEFNGLTLLQSSDAWADFYFKGSTIRYRLSDPGTSQPARRIGRDRSTESSVGGVVRPRSPQELAAPGERAGSDPSNGQPSP